ncbi:uncharacterized protein BX664DRAFT_354834 [Halteromyces radiatus]|uniref:uncharacterized protein n=1 Tax=Halteromyces radiatus TaxID=101107 RepID=UPI002221296E|nr:uncharacterized protein BX664DRAFT_354834 [Halteromyces radiatus]KAI8099414.1 hypothetical protein BX664DRAFT_354834 [Halteromyces radiatus]
MSVSNYIVTFKADTPQQVIDEHIKQAEAAGATIKHRYQSAIRGYSVSVPDDAVTALDNTHPQLDFIEPDGEVTTQGQTYLKS